LTDRSGRRSLETSPPAATTWWCSTTTAGSLTTTWFKTGWTRSSVNRPKGTITDNGTLTGGAPGFVSEAGQDYHLASGSPCIDAGTTLNSAVLPDNDVVREYVKHQLSAARTVHGPLDIRAYEF